MRHSSDTPLHILLSLLLLISSLQSVLAGVAPSPMHDGGSVHVMAQGDGHAMATHHSQVKSPDGCPQCKHRNGCDSHGCTHAQCFSCVPGLLTYVHQLVTPNGCADYAQTDESFIERSISHPFRPPKS